MKQTLLTALALTLGVGALKVASLPPFDPVAQNGWVATVYNQTINWRPLPFVRGSTGAQGATGSAGASGANGAQGVQGNTGVDGTQGTQGVTGNAGPQGAMGATGTIASVNASSLLGVTGATGPAVSIALGGGLEFTSSSVQRSALTGDMSVAAGASSADVTGLQLMSLPAAVSGGFV